MMIMMMMNNNDDNDDDNDDDDDNSTFISIFLVIHYSCLQVFQSVHSMAEDN